MRLFTAWLVTFVLGAGCASSTPADDDAHDGAVPSDGRTPDAAPGPADAGPDAGPPPPRPGIDVISAGGRVRAGTLTIDVTIGHPVDQKTITSGGRELTGATVAFP